MNFEFSDDSLEFRNAARRLLSERCSLPVVRAVLEGGSPIDRKLWDQVATSGWTGASIPEAYGGAGLGYEVLGLLSLELGRALAPLPFVSSIYLAAELILLGATEAQKLAWLPGVAAGSSIGTLAAAEGFSDLDFDNMEVRAEGGTLSGVKWPVIDGSHCDFALVVARDHYGTGVYRVDLNQPGVSREKLQSIDPSRDLARLTFTQARAERMGEGDPRASIRNAINRAAIFVAFEQIGGAEACLYAGRDYSVSRIAFGRPIGSFQAIKHKLAEVYAAVEIARANAYYGVWALTEPGVDLTLAAAAARISATDAFHVAAKENIQVHGGVGFTWDYDCHMFYRRSKQLALAIGTLPYWKEQLASRLASGSRPSFGENHS